MDYKSSLIRMARPRKRKPHIRWWKMKKQDAYTHICIHASSGAENAESCRESRLTINKPDHCGNNKRSVWGNIWKRDIHRERNLVVARRNLESSGLKESNIQTVPDDRE